MSITTAISSHSSAMVLQAAFFEVGLEFGESHLDRVEVWAIGREEAQPRSRLFDCLFDADRLVGREVIHDDDVSWFEFWHEHLLDIGEESRPVHGTIERHRSCHAGEP